MENSCNSLNGDGNIDEHLRLVNIALAYVLSNATLSTTGVEEIEIKKHVGNISTTLRLLTNKSGDLLSYSDKFVENQSGIKVSSLNQILIDNHEQVTHNWRIKSQLQLERFFFVFLQNIQKDYEKLRLSFRH